MALTKRLARQCKSRSPSLYATTFNDKKAGDKEDTNVYKPHWIKASWGSYLTPKGRNLHVIINLDTNPEITDLEIAQSSKLLSVKPAKNATEDMDYSIRSSDALSVKSKNGRVNGNENHSFQSSAISSVKSGNIDVLEEYDDSLRDLSWILRMPGLFPPYNEEAENSNSLQLDESTSTTHTLVEQSSIGPPVDRSLLFREKPLTPMPPTAFSEYDAKTTNHPTVLKPGSLRSSRVRLPQEISVQLSQSVGPQSPLSKGIENPTTELDHQQQLAVTSERNTEESSSWPPMPPRAPPLPPKSDKRQPATITSPPLRPSRTPPVPPEYDKKQSISVARPPPRPPPPPWKPLDPDKRPSVQIYSPLERPSKPPAVPSELELRQAGSQGSKRRIKRRVFCGCKNFIDDALRLSRSSLRNDFGYSFTSSQMGVNQTHNGPESIKAATRAPPLLFPQSILSFTSSYKNTCENGNILTPSSRNSELKTDLMAPSMTSKAGLYSLKATSIELKTKLSRILLRKGNVQGNRNGSEVSSNLPAIEKYRLPELDFRSRTLLPFQCTMCFMHLNNKAEWVQHEQRHNDDDNEEEISDWYWRCGICDHILYSWDDRQNHIADEHFEIGQTLSSWNSSTSPYPWHKLSSKPISGFPHWDMSKLRSMQPTIRDDIFRKAEPRNACGVCDLAFPTPTELDEHMKQDHMSWSCPTTTRKRKAAFFFELCRNGCENQFHSCRCCYMSFCDDSVDWKQRRQHFEDDHHFFDCDHDQFFEHAQFCHHLASSHGVEIDFLSMTDLCRQKEYASS